MDFLELEPQLKAMLGEVGRGGSAFKVRNFSSQLMCSTLCNCFYLCKISFDSKNKNRET